MDTVTEKKVLMYLETIVVNSIDKESRRTAHKAALFMLNSKHFHMVSGKRIADDLYKEVIFYIMQEMKIKAIKRVREDMDTDLRESKELVEQISFIEKIPMVGGYGQED
ncbi:MAG: hypothetical protein J7L15_01075 [Clostridiales bacterium]|nr:hypothetical protein [Clostridiales bacterium]